MDILFSCPHCAQHIEAPPEMAGTAVNCPACNKALLVPQAAPVAVQVPVIASAAKPPLAGRLVAGIIGGLLMAILAANIAGCLFGKPMANPPDSAPVLSAVIFFLVWGAGIYSGLRARSTGKAWRWTMIPCAALAFALPLAVFIMAGKETARLETTGAHMQAGATAVAGGMTAIVAAIFGFFLGAIFLVIGLLVGRDRESKA